MHDAAFSRACEENEIHVAYCNFSNRFYINDITFVPTIIYTYVTYIVTFVTSYTPSTSLGTLYAAMVFWPTLTSNGSSYATVTVVLSVCLSVTLMYCGQTVDASRCHLVGGRSQPRRQCVRWEPSPHPEKRAEPPPQFSAYV